MPRHRDLQQVQMSKSMVAQNRESKQPSVIVILGSLVVFTCGVWCSRADIRHVGLDTYLHCKSRLRDLQGRCSVVHISPICNVAQSIERVKEPER